LQELPKCQRPATLIASQILLLIKMDEKKKRAQWRNRMKFLMSCVAFSIRLGNIWQFPYMVNENGSEAFLIPYILVSFVIGKSFYYMKMVLVQFTSKSCVQMWSVVACISTYFPWRPRPQFYRKDARNCHLKRINLEQHMFR